MQAKATEAAYTLQDPSEVMQFLELMVKWGQSPDNAWAEAASCTGWNFNPLSAEEGSAEPTEEAAAIFKEALLSSGERPCASWEQACEPDNR